MKREWQITRTTMPIPNAQQRWDRAYHLLLQWANLARPAAMSVLSSLPTQEVSDASSAICARIDEPPSPAPND